MEEDILRGELLFSVKWKKKKEKKRLMWMQQHFSEWWSEPDVLLKWHAQLWWENNTSTDHLHLKGSIYHGKGRCRNKDPLHVLVLFLSRVRVCVCVCVCVLLTRSVCSISTGEYGGGPSMPHGASCKMSGVGRQIWRDTMKWTPSSLAWRTFRVNT